MGTRSRIAVQRGDHFESIYCHWDGYLAGAGKTLVEHYADPAKVDALIALGDISSLGAEIGTKHPFDGTHDGVVNAYGRDRGETGIESQRASTLEQLFHQADDSGTEFVYVFQDGVWLYSAHGEFRAFGCGPDPRKGEISPWMQLAPVEPALATAR